MRQLIVGEPRPIGRFYLQPVARLTGRSWSVPDGKAGGGFLRLSPTEVIVHDLEGFQQRLPLPIPTKDALIRLAGDCSGGSDHLRTNHAHGDAQDGPAWLVERPSLITE